jgi:hypothetical protein
MGSYVYLNKIKFIYLNQFNFSTIWETRYKFTLILIWIRVKTKRKNILDHIQNYTKTCSY